MKSYKEFNKIIKDKKILYIPIISCINRDTQEYNLSADGNVNRFITTFLTCNSYNNLTIILPSHHIDNSDFLINKFVSYNKDNICIKYCEYFGIHAGEQRKNFDVIHNMYTYLLSEFNINQFDIIIFESQYLGQVFIKDKIFKNQLIFWNPVSKTNKTRDFLEGYDEINIELIENCDYTIIASPDQCDFYSIYKQDKLIYLDKLIDRKLEIFSKYEIDNNIITILDLMSYDNIIYYLPYRLTDKGYNFELVLKYLENEALNAMEFGMNIKILYSDPNNSHYIDNLEIPELLKKSFIKVSSNRNTYYSILDYHKGVIIPYFEDIEFINHASINEFKDSNAKVILYNQNNNPYNINDYKNFINISKFIT